MAARKKQNFIRRNGKKLHGAAMNAVLRSENARRRKNAPKRRRNVQYGYTVGGVFHPIRASVDYDPRRAGEGVQTRKTKGKKKPAKKAAAKRSTAARRPATKKRALPARKAGKKKTTKRRNYQTSSKPFNQIFGASPAGRFASTLGLTNPGGTWVQDLGVARSYGEKAGRAQRNRDAAMARAYHEYFSYLKRKYKDNADMKRQLQSEFDNAYREENIPLGRRNPKRRNGMLLGINGSRGRKGQRRRHNPDEGLFEQFHGRESDGFKVGLAPDGTPANTEYLGKLECLYYRNNGTHEIKFGQGDHDQPDLVSNRNGTRLYIVGDIPRGNEANYCVGDLTRIEYRAIKNHIDGGVKTLYFHKAGEDTGELPELWTDSEGLLVIKGGNYIVTADGIIN